MIRFFSIMIISIMLNLSAQAKLDSAYSSNSVASLKKILENWSYQSEPIDKSILSQAEKHTYKIFEDFYTPKSLTKFIHSWRKSPYDSTQYYLVQNQIKVKIYEYGEDGNRLTFKPKTSFKIQDFRPSIRVTDEKIIYLKPHIRQAIDAFLSYEEKASQGTPVKHRKQYRPNLKQRLDFLSNFAILIPGHWGGYLIETHPYIASISFDQNFTEAFVNCIMKYGGYEAEYKREKDIWELVIVRGTWIE